MNEAETRAEHIDPALKAAGWGVVDGSTIRREYRIAPGRIEGPGKRARPEIADYVLVHNGHKLAVIEAKAWDEPVSLGVAQAKSQAGKMAVRFAYASNGQGIYAVDMKTGAEGDCACWPSPDELWGKTFSEANAWRDRFAAVPFESKGGAYDGRYYQDIAIDRVLEAVAHEKQRILLTLATGTGKTFIAFQIAWKLFHARWNLSRQPTRRPRILFLADRNILADQAYNAFSPFDMAAPGSLIRIAPDEIRKKGSVPKNGSIFFTIFQTFMASAGSAQGARLEPAEGASSVQDSCLAEINETNVVDAAAYVYILECSDGSFYVGCTESLAARLAQHRAGEGSLHTAARPPVKLVYCETFDSAADAYARERQIKGWSRAKKVALIRGDTARLRQLSQNRQALAPSADSGRAPSAGSGRAPSAGSGRAPSAGSGRAPSAGSGRVEGPRPEPVEGYFGDYPADFFDFIVIDECHRGGANDESNWRGILEYFAPAVQLGLTATPKRRDNVDTYKFFGDPVYVYSLKDGINDGFLTPFRVKQIATTLDEYVYTPDDTLVEGEVESGRRYVESDFNRIIEIREREKKRVEIFMNMIDQREKTLVFCATQDHALAVRDLVNQMKTASTDPNYCQRVTADDGELGEQHLRDFQDNERTIPTVLTTSQKLSTGVDARNVRNIVLMRPINSMIEFKQIIGRGTRLYDGKDYFTIYDFVKAYEHFSDPEWDGPPQNPEPRTPRPPTDRPPKPPEPQPDPPPRPKKIKVKLANGKDRTIQHMVATTFWHADGTPMSAEQFLVSLFGAVPEFFRNEGELRALWSDPVTRRNLLDGLAEKGFGRAQLAEMQKLIDAEKSDIFDVLAYVAFALPPLSREERAIRSKPAIASRFSDKQRAFLDFVLAQYVKVGVDELSPEKLSPLLKLKYNNAIADAVADLGQAEEIGRMFTGFQKYLYEVAA